MIISHRHRFIFLKTVKTAGTSVEIALSRVCGPDDVVGVISPRDEKLRQSLGGVSAQNNTSPPLPTVASSHGRGRRARLIVGPEQWDEYTKVSVERNPWDTVVSLYYWLARTRKDMMPFEEFVHSPRVDHLATKNSRIYRMQGENVVQHMLRTETLDADLRELWTTLDLPDEPVLPHAKGHVRPRESSYREMYDERGRDRVAEAFADSIRDFGYEF